MGAPETNPFRWWMNRVSELEAALANKEFLTADWRAKCIAARAELDTVNEDLHRVRAAVGAVSEDVVIDIERIKDNFGEAIERLKIADQLADAVDRWFQVSRSDADWDDVIANLKKYQKLAPEEAG